MAGPHTPRARARAMMLAEIKQQALAQLAAVGPASLSLRAIARELDLVSSGLYRYYRSRDELLTALIVDAYADLATAVEAADCDLPAGAHRERWVARLVALRTWARQQPSRFQLLYGSPVPGYAAPPDTVAPATAVILAVLRVPAEAAAAGVVTVEPWAAASEQLGAQLAAVGSAVGLDLAPGTLVRAVAAFGEVIGLVTLELGGHFVGGFDPVDLLFDAAVADLADRLGLPG